MTEYKVGDWVVLLSNIAPELNSIYEIWKPDLIGCIVVDKFDEDSRFFYTQIRHATPEEIKAGKRLP